jgi:hypothetical protein
MLRGKLCPYNNKYYLYSAFCDYITQIIIKKQGEKYNTRLRPFLFHIDINKEIKNRGGLRDTI